jgi:hypothetical protein
MRMQNKGVGIIKTRTRSSGVLAGAGDTRGLLQRNRQFQHFIKPRLFKISTLTMKDFVEKFRKIVTATYSCSMCALLVTRHISTR